ncbi:MAG: hypothetical protein ACRD36_07600, partial [Candidatus Acidiferrum sp.]
MKFLAEVQGLDSRALQFSGKRLHLATDIRQMGITQLGSQQSAALDVNFQAVQERGNTLEGFV